MKESNHRINQPSHQSHRRIESAPARARGGQVAKSVIHLADQSNESSNHPRLTRLTRNDLTNFSAMRVFWCVLDTKMDDDVPAVVVRLSGEVEQ